jgi:hypothetical protein
VGLYREWEPVQEPLAQKPCQGQPPRQAALTRRGNQQAFCCPLPMAEDGSGLHPGHGRVHQPFGSSFQRLNIT